MDLVIDANVIFAALIKENRTYDLIFDEKLHLFTTEFFLAELEKHRKELQEKTGKSEAEINNLFNILKRRITFIPLKELLPYLDEAENISPDLDDVAYLALALKLNCGIWSNDRKLKENQNKVKVYSTIDLIKNSS